MIIDNFFEHSVRICDEIGVCLYAYMLLFTVAIFSVRHRHLYGRKSGINSFNRSSLYNSKIFELFNIISVVDFTVDEVFTELRYKSEIHNGSILLFQPADKLDISPLHPTSPFKSSSVLQKGAKDGRNIHHKGSIRRF